MIHFKKDDLHVILVYESELADGNEWIYREFEGNNSIHLKRTFHLTEDNLWAPDVNDFGNKYMPEKNAFQEFKETQKTDDDIENFTDFDIDIKYRPVEFKIAVKIDDYYKYINKLLNIKNELFIHESIDLTTKTFTAARNISIFPKISNITNKPIYIGGEHEDAIPEKDFNKLIKNFPNSYELDKYVSAKIDAIIGTYIETKIDAQKQYNDYMNKKIGKVGLNIFDFFAESEHYKINILYNKLKEMLDGEEDYNENQWQEEILQIIRFLYPKYIQSIKEVTVKDSYLNKDKRIDLLLIDATGNTDIIEIKKPFDKCIVTNKTYRDNYIPLRELSGTVMQVEKYIFNLNKWGKKGEETLTAHYKEKLPKNFKIKITNPNGILIMGRSNNLTTSQMQDFEVIKRKYKHVIDILTYDDLLNRLKFTLEQWKNHAN